ncbi:MAG: DUF87 domain-containing protein [Candidatus Thiodiazotropha sp.]
MSISPVEHSASLRIGAVEFVSPDEIKVALDLEAPDGIAANAGIPRAFPRINSYVLVATESGHIVAQVEWIAVERSPFPKRKGFQDYGLVDLPFPLRKMRVNPLGILKKDSETFVFKRGVHGFPSVGEPVLIPTDEQLRAIIESGERRRVKIGTSPMAANADVCVDPDRLFGRHLAVLGNTGSGKSCSVAGLIQWSIAASNNSDKPPNARFIVLDPNGEYSKVFQNEGRVFKVGDSTNPLQVPLWFWNSAEWCSFTQASARAQVPLLKRALRAMRNENFDLEDNPRIQARRFVQIILTIARASKSAVAPFNQNFGPISSFVDAIDRWRQSLITHDGRIDEDLQPLVQMLETLHQAHLTVSNTGFRNYSIFTAEEIDGLISLMCQKHQELGGTEQDLLPKSEDIPTRFTGEVFVNFLEALAQETGNEQYVEFLLARIRTMLADTRMKDIIGDGVDISLENWLGSYIGEDEAGDGCVTIIDLSLVPADIVHVVTAVVARMTFEALQRYRKLNDKSLPTVLVMEEAHTFVKRYKEDTENQSASSVCCQMFEKISREGRKFGLGLVLSSQRPSELSPTVLSQCNTFLLHRVSNDRDQELIHRLVPDNLRGLLRELPSLPSQQAILLGWASELPIMVRMNDLADHERPQSDDPDFWDVWSRSKERAIDWAKIAEDWQQTAQEDGQGAENGQE